LEDRARKEKNTIKIDLKELGCEAVGLFLNHSCLATAPPPTFLSEQFFVIIRNPFWSKYDTLSFILPDFPQPSYISTLQESFVRSSMTSLANPLWVAINRLRITGKSWTWYNWLKIEPVDGLL
jgi:hypothetical protein